MKVTLVYKESSRLTRATQTLSQRNKIKTHGERQTDRKPVNRMRLDMRGAVCGVWPGVHLVGTFRRQPTGARWCREIPT